MSKLEERIAKESKELERIDREEREGKKRAEEKNRKDETHRQIIIGGYVCTYFPEVLHYQPRLTKAENDIEFGSLIDFISLLADDVEYITKLKKHAEQESKKRHLGNQQEV